MRKTSRLVPVVFVVLSLAICTPLSAGWKVTAWNDLGMHCTDGTDYSLFGILPPYNNIHAQVIDASGRLVKSGSGITVTYEAMADPSGSINTTSAGKTNFWTWATALFGANLPVDSGLAGSSMPGASNTPQPMKFDAAHGWFTAEGIPLTPYDDAGSKNYYPMMRIVVRDSGGKVLATAPVVLPVSDEMDCGSCHAADSNVAARPVDGWLRDPDPNREFKLNVLRLHDERQLGTDLYTGTLTKAGYDSRGLLVTAQGGHPILCAQCHASNALPGTGYTGLEPLTEAIHARHAYVPDPVTHLPLESSENRESCYRCHPGASTRCLRGAMGSAVGADASLTIQCQNCHGSMSYVGRSGRTGWLEEPACQSCHAGTASTSSTLRYSDVFVAPGVMRSPADTTFATSPGVPAAGFDLYRFSRGHGGLYCEACHGSTHAEYPSHEGNDNLQSISIQGHSGVLSECGSCHPSVPNSVSGGPHGLHPVGAQWVSQHSDVAEHNSSSCVACHGKDYRGTALSMTFADRTLSTKFGSKFFWKGFQVGCYACHNGPSSESASRNHPPSVAAASARGLRDIAVVVPLSATDPDGNAVTLRVVSQPLHGFAAIEGMSALYRPDPGYIGTDSFTVAAWDGSVQSALATVSVTIDQPAPRSRPVRR